MRPLYHPMIEPSDYINLNYLICGNSSQSILAVVWSGELQW
jgi:hypothetical protein